MRKIGVCCDDWKKPHFERALDDAKLTNREVFQLPHKVTLIRVLVEEDKYLEVQEQIRRLCVRLEHNLKRSN